MDVIVVLSERKLKPADVRKSAVCVSHECAEQKRECGGGGEWHTEVERDESSHRNERQPRERNGQWSAERQARDTAGDPGERQHAAHAARVGLAAQPGEHRERNRGNQILGRRREMADAVRDRTEAGRDDVRGRGQRLTR